MSRTETKVYIPYERETLVIVSVDFLHFGRQEFVKYRYKLCPKVEFFF